ncbi:MAG: S9 family peptidase [Pseudomonadales bacterium]|nr:S9 family peptidase [Pseudomonadales bacterium]
MKRSRPPDRSNRRVGWLLVLALLPVAGTAGQAIPSIHELVSPSRLTDVKVSPGGDYLGLRVRDQNGFALHFLDLKTRAEVGVIAFAEQQDVGGFQWVGKKQVVSSVRLREDFDELPARVSILPGRYRPNRDELLDEVLRGRFFFADVNGRWLSQRQRRERGEPVVDDPLLADDRHALVSLHSDMLDGRNPTSLYRVDFQRDRWKLLRAVPLYSAGTFFADTSGAVQLVTSIDDDGRTHAQVLTSDGKWVEVPQAFVGARFRPLSITADGKHAWVLNDASTDRLGVYRMSLLDFRSDLIYLDDNVDVTSAFVCPDRKSVCRVRVDDGYPRYISFPDAGRDAIDLDVLARQLSGVVTVTSWSLDGRYWTIRRETDRDAGSFFLFDRQAKTLEPIGAGPKQDRDRLAPMEPVSFSAPDGKKIQGYLTRAVGESSSRALVVLLHDGPDERDYWSYSPAVQVLATRGISVLQINFRGSIGYGRAFAKASTREWGRAVQQDIIAGTRWAISEGIAAPKRVCIMGDGFGAYSALQSATLAPDLYGCVVVRGGIYDLADIHSHYVKFRSTYYGQRYISDQVGSDRDELEAYSPIDHVDELDAPVLIVHGHRDTRVPLVKATWLKRVLKSHQKPARLIDVPGAASIPFYAEEEAAYLDAVVDFVSRHIGATSGTSQTSPSEHSCDSDAGLAAH